MRTSRTLIVTAVLAALTLSGCTAPVALEGRGSASPTPAPTTSAPASAPAPDATPLLIPTEPVAGEVASAVVDSLVSPPSASSVAGPGVLVPDRPFSVEGECIGSRGAFELMTADPDDAGRTLVAGTIDCSAPMKNGYATTLDYAGPVQLVFRNTDGIDQGWLRVVQP